MKHHSSPRTQRGTEAETSHRGRENEPRAEEQHDCQYGGGFTFVVLGERCLYHTSVKSNNTTEVQLLAVNIFSA